MADKVALDDLLIELRNDLQRAQVEGKDSDLRFKVEDIEIELQITTTQGKEGGGGAKLWVLSANAKANASQANTQKLKLKLGLVKPNGNTSPLISDEGAKPG